MINVDKEGSPEKAVEASDTLREAQPVTPEPLYLTLSQRLEFYPINDAYYNRLRLLFQKKLKQTNSKVVAFHTSTSPSAPVLDLFNGSPASSSGKEFERSPSKTLRGEKNV